MPHVETNKTRGLLQCLNRQSMPLVLWKKKSHLAFNFPRKFHWNIRKPPQNNSRFFNKGPSKPQKKEFVALVKEFAGMVISTNKWYHSSHDKNYQQKKNSYKNNGYNFISCKDKGHILSAFKSPEWYNKTSFYHHKMRQRNQWR